MLKRMYFAILTALTTVPVATAPAVAQTASAASLDAAAREAVVTQLATALRDRYVFPDVGEQAAARIGAALAAGEYDSLNDPAAFAARLHADVEAIAKDKHLRISGGTGQPPPAAQAPVAMPPSEAGVAVRRPARHGGAP